MNIINNSPDLIVTDWKLSQERIDDLEKYYLLHWTTRYYLMKTRYDISPHTITHQEIVYLVQYHDCSFKEIKDHKEVQLSFRKSHGDPEGIVLVRPMALQHPQIGWELKNKRVIMK